MIHHPMPPNPWVSTVCRYGVPQDHRGRILPLPSHPSIHPHLHLDNVSWSWFQSSQFSQIGFQWEFREDVVGKGDVSLLCMDYPISSCTASIVSCKLTRSNAHRSTERNRRVLGTGESLFFRRLLLRKGRRIGERFILEKKTVKAGCCCFLTTTNKYQHPFIVLWHLCLLGPF